MRRRRAAQATLAVTGLLGILATSGGALAVQTNLQETMPVVWVLLVISVAGAALTYALLSYALWKFRDPATRGRRYG